MNSSFEFVCGLRLENSTDFGFIQGDVRNWECTGAQLHCHHVRDKVVIFTDTRKAFPVSSDAAGEKTADGSVIHVGRVREPAPVVDKAHWVIKSFQDIPRFLRFNKKAVLSTFYLDFTDRIL